MESEQHKNLMIGAYIKKEMILVMFLSVKLKILMNYLMEQKLDQALSEESFN